MNTKSVLGLVDQLEDDVEDLEEKLEPLLVNSLTATTKKLPLLDRAKLNVLLVYAIESLIFCQLPSYDPLLRSLTSAASITQTPWRPS